MGAMASVGKDACIGVCRVNPWKESAVMIHRCPICEDYEVQTQDDICAQCETAVEEIYDTHLAQWDNDPCYPAKAIRDAYRKGF